MRVITGSAKGRRLVTLPGTDTRPTSGMVKEAVFSILNFELEGANVLDLFAGSGQLGIEALSRGAKFCVFVDNSKACQDILRKNLDHTGLAAKARLVGTDARSFLATASGPFDVSIIDPPYGKNMAAPLLATVAAMMAQTGVIVCEAASDEALPETAGDIPLHRTYRYGSTQLAVYRRALEDL